MAELKLAPLCLETEGVSKQWPGNSPSPNTNTTLRVTKHTFASLTLGLLPTQPWYRQRRTWGKAYQGKWSPSVLGWGEGRPYNCWTLIGYAKHWTMPTCESLWLCIYGCLLSRYTVNQSQPERARRQRSKGRTSGFSSKYPHSLYVDISISR